MNWQSATCEIVVLIQKIRKASEMSIIQKKDILRVIFISEHSFLTVVILSP